MKIRLLTLVDGTPHPCSGQFVVAFDPSYVPPSGLYDGGLLEVTHDPRKAREFGDLHELTEYWRQSHGLREDGEPNRPLTAFNIEVL